MRVKRRLRRLLLGVSLTPAVFSGCRIDGDALDRAFHESGSHYTWTDGSTTLEVRLSGEFETNDEESDVVSLSAGGRVEVTEQREGQERRFSVIRANDAQLKKTYSVDGTAREFDGEAEQWLSSVLPRILRETGFAASRRVRAKLEQGGVDAVLNEISQIRDGTARRIYIEELIGSTRIDCGTALRVAQESAGIDSDSDQSRLIFSLVDLCPQDSAVTDRLIDAAATIRSSPNRRQALQAIAEKRELASQAVIRCVESAADIRSSSEKSALLALLAKQAGGEFEVQMSLLEAAATISSSFEKRRAVESILDAGVQSPIAFKSASDVIFGITSSSEKAAVLTKLAEILPVDPPESLDSFLNCVTSLRSVSDKERVLSVLLGRKNLNEEVRRRVRTLVESEIPEGPIRSRLLKKSL